ncbi:MAG: glycosyltransferase family 2 protein [Candidatus Acidiferrum sp.]
MEPDTVKGQDLIVDLSRPSDMNLSAETKTRVTTAIVLLNWNSREMTAECIRSIVAMNATDYEIIVVDNGSKDSSPEYLHSLFPEITILPQDRNLGFAAGCNVGMRSALERGVKYVLPLNNDTVVDPSFLSELQQLGEDHPQAAMISPKIYFWDMPDRFWWAGGSFSLWTGMARHVGRKERDVGQFDLDVELDWATGCAVLIRTDALRKTGLFDETFFGNAEDLDLSLRMKNAGYKIWFAPRAKLWHKEGVDYRKNAGEYLRKFTGTRNLLYVMRKHAGIIQWLTFWPNFLVRYVGFYVALSTVRRDYRSAWAVLEGIFAFFTNRSHHEAVSIRESKTLHSARAHVWPDRDT